MKAITYTQYGSPDVLHLGQVEKPTPKEDEVLIRIHAVSINSRDWRMLRADPFFIRLMGQGLLRPKTPILGADVAGRVEAVGSAVTKFRPGEEVFGELSRYGGRTFAEYVCAAEDEISFKPSNLTFEQAAAVPMAALTALQGLRDKGNVRPGQKVLVQGASGGVGTFAVQIARYYGARVTGVCSARNLDMVRSLGADHAIDYQREDFTRSGQQYDLILAVNGYRPISDYLRSLSPEGTYVVAGGSMRQLFQATLREHRNAGNGGPKIYVVSQAQSQADLVFLKELLEAGRIMPVIDGCYPLDKTADAFRYYEKEHPRGKVVITMG